MAESFNDSLDEIRELNRALGRLDEQERIIKLLEDIKNEPQRKQENWLHKVARTAFATAAIKLIKGEQK